MDACAEHLAQVDAIVLAQYSLAPAAAILEAVDADQPPLRLVLGSTTIAKFRAVYEARLNNWSKWEAVSNAAQGTRTV